MEHAATREMYQDLFVAKKLQNASAKFEKWMNRRAPDILQTLRQIVPSPPHNK
jgi:hypothetical protein